MVTHCKNVYNLLHWEAIPSSIYKCVEPFKSKINSGPSIQSPVVDFHSFYFIHYKNNGFQKYIYVELSFNVESMATAKKKKEKQLISFTLQVLALVLMHFTDHLIMLLVYNGERGDG